MKEGEIHPPVRAGQSLPGPGGEMRRAGQTVGAYLSAPLHFASAEREHKKHISLLQRWK